MAPHSSTLAWKIPWMEEPGRLQSMWSLRVRHDWVTSLSLFTFMHWRRKWQPTPVFLPGESQGAWWAAIYGVAQSRTWLKWISSRSSSCLAGEYAILCRLLWWFCDSPQNFHLCCHQHSLVLHTVLITQSNEAKNQHKLFGKSDTQPSLLAVPDLIGPFSFFIAGKSGVWVLLAVL